MAQCAHSDKCSSQIGKIRTTPIRRTAVWVTSVSWQSRVSNWGHPLKTLGSSQHYLIEAFIGCPPLGLRHLSDWRCKFFPDKSSSFMRELIRRLKPPSFYWCGKWSHRCQRAPHPPPPSETMPNSVNLCLRQVYLSSLLRDTEANETAIIKVYRLHMKYKRRLE